MDYYFLIILGIFLIPVSAQIYINSCYSKYSKKMNRNKLSGFEIARDILDENELEDLHIVETNGILTDHYDPNRNVIRLSHDIFDENSIASSAVAAHECGHAIQQKEGYIFLRIRSFLVPIVNFSSKFAYFLLLFGVLLEYYGLIELAIVLMSLGVLFQLITLPVEINASKRAKQQLIKLNLLDDEEIDGASNMLTAAALTYVAGLLASLLQLLRLITIFGGGRRD